jgi:signal transduction histidine kinase
MSVPEHLRAGPGRDRAIDVALALGSFLFAVMLIANGGFGAEEVDARGLDAPGVALAAMGSLPLVFRRTAIVPVFVVVFAAYTAIAALRYPIDIMLGPLIALYTLAGAAGRTVPRPLALAVAAAGYISVWCGIAVGYDLARVADVEAVLFVLLWVAIWMAGDRAHLRREHIASLEERAERAERAAERERRLAAAEERTRIARDLHDSAGHAINVILVEAGAARLLRERDPDRAEQALETIEEVARGQIGEIDRLVHALRADDDPELGGLDADCSPAPGVPVGPAAGQALIERMRASGLELQVERTGETRMLGPTVGRAMFRILQESLTNAVRHGTGSARLTLDFGGDAVEVRVENRTEGSGPNGEGYGLIGMRERVALIGGEFEAGRRQDLFTVRALLPYDRGFERHAAARANGAEAG